jgi:hypothetical protein
VARLVKTAEGGWEQTDEDPDTYEINASLIQMIMESPLNGFLVFLGNAPPAGASGVAEAKESAEAEGGAEATGDN